MIDRSNDDSSRLLNRVLLIAFAALVATLAGVFLGSGTLRTLSDIKSELTRRKGANDVVAAGNRDLREEVDALKDDPLVLETAIRNELSLVDDGEVIILFDGVPPTTRGKAAPRVSLRSGSP